MARWKWPAGINSAGINIDTFMTAARTAVAAVISLLLARTLKLPEYYWAPISTLVILLSTINPLTLAWQRFAGTALGAGLGAVIATSLGTGPHWPVYGAGIFICGILCALLRMASAYRFAAIALTIVLIIVHERSPWMVAVHRFVEVSLGIAVGLAVTAICRVPANRG